MHIPRGPAITTDGQLSAGDWDRAAKAVIHVAPDWMVNVLLQHDDKNLYLAFSGLTHGVKERYPEVLLDPSNEKPLFWKQGQQ